MKLYYFKGSCALAVHIVLEWVGADYELHEIKRRDARSPEFLENVNPYGKVPVLELENGQKIHQVTALLSWLTKKYPEAKLGPAENSIEANYETQNLLSYFNSDIHPAFTPFFLTGRFTTDDSAKPSIKEAGLKELEFHLNNLNKHMENRDWVINDKRSILDAYLVVFCQWINFLPQPLEKYQNLKAFSERMMANDGVKSALQQQGLI